jgi:hypothetical protein
MLRDAAADRRMAETRSVGAYLPQILAYPLSGHAPAALAMFALLLWAGTQSVMGIPMLAIVAPWTSHYAEAVYQRTSMGQATAPPFGGDMIYLGSASSILWALLSVAATVGVTMVASRHGIGTLLALALTIYLVLVSCHLAGFVAFHRSEPLGLPGEARSITPEVRREEQQQARLEAVLKKIDAALHAKDLDGAAAALVAEPGGPADLRLFHEELFEQVTFRRNAALTHLQGQRLITVLIGAKRVARALDIAETCYDAHRDFQPARPAEAVVLAQQALTDKREGLFTRLTHDAAARYGSDPAAVSLAFLSARLWCEQKRDDERAREILKPLLAASSHPQHRQIVAYAKALAKPATP